MNFYEECAYAHGQRDAERGTATDGGAAYYQRHDIAGTTGSDAYQRGHASVVRVAS